MLSPHVRRSLAPRRQTPVLDTPTTREKVSVIGALSFSPLRQQPQLYFRSYPNENVNAERSADFLRSLLRQIRGKLLVLWDGAAIHRGPAVRELLSQTRRLTLHSLPAYAPELNPVEYLWSYLKTTKLANITLADALDLDAVVTHSLHEIATQPPLLKSFYKASPLEQIETTLFF